MIGVDSGAIALLGKFVKMTQSIKTLSDTNRRKACCFYENASIAFKRDTPISEIFTPFTYICIIYGLSIVIMHKDR